MYVPNSLPIQIVERVHVDVGSDQVGIGDVATAEPPLSLYVASVSGGPVDARRL